METKGSKRLGQQSCDSCGREFVVRRYQRVDGRSQGMWQCPYCGFDNRVGVERCQGATHRAQEKHRKSKEKHGQSD